MRKSQIEKHRKRETDTEKKEKDTEKRERVKKETEKEIEKETEKGTTKETKVQRCAVLEITTKTERDIQRK